MKYTKELEFIKEEFIKIRDTFLSSGPVEKHQKSEFDIVTEIDCNIETYLAGKIRDTFPGDKVLGEEWSSNEEISGRTWTLDPIDGTVNFAHESPVFGVQVALIDEGELVLGAVYLPKLEEVFTAVKGCGCFLNDKKIVLEENVKLSSAIMSFGDYSHTAEDMAEFQHEMIRKIYPVIAKIRMFGAACFDFAFAACGRTHGTVLMTRNLWDLLPGVILCREAGLQVNNLKGDPYQIGDYGVVAAVDSVMSAIKSR